MALRSILIRLGGLAAITALALFAFATTAPAHKADAATGPACTFSVPIATIAQTGGSDTVTCMFMVNGTKHTFVATFTVTLTAHPPIKVDSCILDGSAIHVGPCP